MMTASVHGWMTSLLAQGILLGCLVVLFLVCAVQSWLLRRLARSSSRRPSAASVGKAEQAAPSVPADHRRANEKLLALENQALQWLIRERDPWQAVDRLLQQLVPDTGDGFAALLEIQGETQQLLRSLGLSQHSQDSLRLDQSLVEQLDESMQLILDGRDLAKTELWTTLSPNDRRKLRQLFVAAERTEPARHLTLLTTQLPVPQAPLKERMGLVSRLLSAAAVRLDEAERVRKSENELRETKQRLEIRMLVDRHFATPLKMLEVTLEKLLDCLQAERGAIVVVGRDRSARCAVRCGQRLPAGVDRQVQRWEEWLGAAKASAARAAALNEQELRELGVESLIRSALVVPAYRKEGSAGVLVVTRQTNRLFDEKEMGLAEWTAGLLNETLCRVVDLAEMQRQARRDGLTELPNRRAFDEEIERQLAEAARSGYECSLLMFDLDRFKSVNDRYGHLAGDEVLRASASVITNALSKVRSSDKVFLARYGGEELAALLPRFGTAGAVRLAEAARSALERSAIPFEKHVLQVTVSVGVATFPIHAKSPEDLITAADQALYEAKRAGRNRVCVATTLPAPAHV